ncbi:hypothetical protein J7384_17405 [Endozoicomonas sp. G2_1]|uniref:DUF6436 domain-containing protein n=1 Tax=Endozoicomonas sp. G2_1 TaxID=2821091 RepID=UPI001ADCCDC4|nr:DUF6436 domain-containing protein [Endozoicomonas sp. G2_1]MBO9492141.1 hypothetical protein [Endozoicomonas sp. G2_1]
MFSARGKNKTLGLYLAFFAWLVISAIGLWWSFGVRLIDFDSQQKLTDAARVLSFDRDIETVFGDKFGSLANQAFHISEAGCFCQQVASSHIGSVKSLLTENHYDNQTLEIHQFDILAQYLPATPAVVIFNQRGQLGYFGPYSTGLLCSSGNGFVEQLIDRLNSQQHYGAAIVSAAKGCYCPTNVKR